MPQEFNLDEIFTIAVDIEKNGEKFYRRAAELTKDKDAKKLLAELADWEKGHIKTFSDLRSRLLKASEKALAWDPYGEVELYLQSVANRNVFNVDQDYVEFAESQSSINEVLEFALAREKESVVFYTSLDMVLPADLSGGKVHAIIKEEISHIRLITEKLAQLG
ncbi:ferritin family protein [Gemmatimonadota bacterium]